MSVNYTSYAEQRRNRLFDSVCEYFDDEQAALLFYDDLVGCINECGQYYRSQLQNVTTTLKLINDKGIPRVDGDAVQSEVEHPDCG